MSIHVTTNPRYQHDAGLHQLLQRLPEAFAAGEGQLIYDKRNKLRRFVLPSGLVVIVKAYRQPNAFQRLCYSTFWANKAVKSYRFGLRLIQAGIETPEPIAAVTYRSALGLVDRYFFASTEDLRPDCSGLREGTIAQPQPLIDALAAFLIRLHQLGFLHGDTNLNNFLYEPTADGSFRFAVIDTNRSRFLSHEPSRRQVYRNLVRLTHVRPLLSAFARSYARQRGWDAKEAEHAVLDLIQKRERQKAFWHRFKS